ncbi:MAG TPA: AAA family ATPase [Sphingomicrobium sp.]|nr:AAA family ATPase [Sphingomicrobium sp.]
MAERTGDDEWPVGYGPAPPPLSPPDDGYWQSVERDLAAQEPLPTWQREQMGLSSLPLIDLASWQGLPPARRSLWGDMLPLLQTTMLTGDGGVGKSLFSQVLHTHVALGRPFLGMQVEQRTALYVTCEDDEAELWRRQTAICERIGVPIESMVGKLFLCSLTGKSATALATFDESGRIKPTDRWREIEDVCDANSIGLFAFDNATDAMAGDLNDIHQVAEFVNMLTGLAIHQDGVALIVHHPNKKGEEWLGSVAWHNKVRSRLLIKRGSEADPDSRVISNPKANYGPQGGEVAFRWYRGTFVRDEDLPADFAAELNATIRATTENGRFLDCLSARNAQGEGRGVGPSSGPNYAPAQFEGMPEARGLKKEALKRAMERLFATGAIETHEHKVPGKGRTVTLIREPGTPPERTPERLPNTGPDHPRTVQPNTPPHTPYTYGNKGAGSEAAAPSDAGDEPDAGFE